VERARLDLRAPAAGRALLAAVALAGLSLLAVAPAPSYDPWAWLLWGREVAGGALDTREGPAFKPLPVAVCALLAPLGAAAPVVWVAIVRVAALLALWLAFRLGRQLGGGSLWAGLLAAAGVALCGRFLAYSAAGAEPALLLALALGGAEAWRAGRVRLALACGVGCALLRVETWPFLVVGGVWLARTRPEWRAALAAAAALVPAAWFLPELAGSGDLLRSGSRARVPNPGQPALAAVPAAASVREAAGLLLWPLWIGLAALAAWATRRDAAARRALIPAGVGLAWVAVVAALAQAGFSGEARYAMPGVALIALSGAAGLGLALRRAPRPFAGAVLVAGLLVLAAGPRAAELRGVRAAQAYQWQLAAELGDVVRAAGGRRGVLACGRPYVGRYRGPLMAYQLRVVKAVVEPDALPRAPAVVFRSALTPTAEPTPVVPAGARTVVRSPLWRVQRTCRS
jgi:hypothetical protein